MHSWRLWFTVAEARLGWQSVWRLGRPLTTEAVWKRSGGLEAGFRSGWPQEASGTVRMLDHVTIGVSGIERAKLFYDKVLPVLGISRLYAEGDVFAGYGAEGKAFFWIGQRGSQQTSVHVAFTCRSRADVDRFHEAALLAGGVDNGGPGLRPHYHQHYYGAFVLDPDGHNIEAVCHLASDG